MDQPGCNLLRRLHARKQVTLFVDHKTFLLVINSLLQLENEELRSKEDLNHPGWFGIGEIIMYFGNLRWEKLLPKKLFQIHRRETNEDEKRRTIFPSWTKEIFRKSSYVLVS